VLGVFAVDDHFAQPADVPPLIGANRDPNPPTKMRVDHFASASSRGSLNLSRSTIVYFLLAGSRPLERRVKSIAAQLPLYHSALY